jgi:hypothetical protein
MARRYDPPGSRVWEDALFFQLRHDRELGHRVTRAGNYEQRGWFNVPFTLPFNGTEVGRVVDKIKDSCRMNNDIIRENEFLFIRGVDVVQHRTYTFCISFGYLR